MIKLGQKAKDLVTGFEGIIVARVEYLNGCVQYCLKPKMIKGDKNKMPEGEYIDAKQIKIIDDGILVEQKKTGGIMDDIPSDRY